MRTHVNPSLAYSPTSPALLRRVVARNERSPPKRVPGSWIRRRRYFGGWALPRLPLPTSPRNSRCPRPMSAGPSRPLARSRLIIAMPPKLTIDRDDRVRWSRHHKTPQTQASDPTTCALLSIMGCGATATATTETPRRLGGAGGEREPIRVRSSSVHAPLCSRKKLSTKSSALLPAWDHVNRSAGEAAAPARPRTRAAREQAP
jgi:hypothetical protein